MVLRKISGNKATLLRLCTFPMCHRLSLLLPYTCLPGNWYTFFDHTRIVIASSWSCSTRKEELVLFAIVNNSARYSLLSYPHPTFGHCCVAYRIHSSILLSTTAIELSQCARRFFLPLLAWPQRPPSFRSPTRFVSATTRLVRIETRTPILLRACLLFEV